MKPWNSHNYYRGEKLHDDGYFGPEPIPVCESCEDANGEYFVEGLWFCWDCLAEYRVDHPDPEEAAAEAEYKRELREDR